MAVLCFGGSFNPIHHGHLICARAVAEQAGFGQILLIPTGQPPHKPDVTQLAEAHHRLRMCRLATAGDSFFEVSDHEITGTGPSYTLYSARALKDQRGWSRVSWLIGADMVAILPQWHQPEALLREVDFVLMARPGWTFNWTLLPAEFQRLAERVVPAPLIDLSGTGIRRRVAQGLSVSYMTPTSVVDYIEANGLYR